MRMGDAGRGVVPTIRRVVPRSKIFWPLAATVVFVAAYWFFQVNPLRTQYGDVREVIFGKRLRWLLFAACVPLIFLAVRLFDAFTFDFLLARRRKVAAPQLLREILAIVLYVILFAWAISAIFDYRVSGFLVSGTVVAAVLGLALQDTLGNLFAGIALHLEDSFEVGDVIKSGDHIGVVEHVRWRATRIRTFTNHVAILPNSLLARERLEVFPFNNANARILSVAIDSNIPPATVIDLLTQAASQVEGVERDIPTIARIASLSDSSVNYEIKYFTRQYAERERIDADIRKAVWYALRRNAMPERPSS